MAPWLEPTFSDSSHSHVSLIYGDHNLHYLAPSSRRTHSFVFRPHFPNRLSLRKSLRNCRIRRHRFYVEKTHFPSSNRFRNTTNRFTGRFPSYFAKERIHFITPSPYYRRNSPCTQSQVSIANYSQTSANYFLDCPVTRGILIGIGRGPYGSIYLIELRRSISTNLAHLVLHPKYGPFWLHSNCAPIWLLIVYRCYWLYLYGIYRVIDAIFAQIVLLFVWLNWFPLIRVILTL